MPHQFPAQKLEAREPNIKNDLKLYFEDDHLENLKANSLQQGDEDAPMGDLGGDHDKELATSKDVQKVLQTLRDRMAGSDCYYLVHKQAPSVSLWLWLRKFWVI